MGIRTLKGHIEVIGGELTAATRFSDSMLAPDQPQAIGDAWFTTFNLINASGTAGVTISQGLNRTASGLNFTNASGAGYLPTAICIPRDIYYPNVISKNQFIQFTWVTSVGIADLDLGLLGTQNSFLFYGVNFISNTGQWNMLKRTSGGNTGLIPASGATTFANGDVMRFTADVQASSSQTVLTVFKNGTQQGQFIDNTGGRISSGIPMLYFNGANPGASITFKDFSCGRL